MEIIISSNTSKPIYEQITSQIKAMIMSGELRTGEAIPSMCALAKSLHVSVITVQKAYEDLQRDGFIETTVGRGSFVSAQNKDFFQEELVRYAFDPDIPSVPEKELTVYSLYDNYQMRTAITEFREENPDVYVDYETAMTGDDAMTVSDAIKTLNTNIMAGEGQTEFV